MVERVAIVKTRVDKGGSYSRGGIKVKGMPNTAKITDVVVTGAGKRRYLFGKGKGGVKNEAKISCRRTW